MIRCYRDLKDADHVWTGRLIRVTLEEKTYRIERGQIHWFTGLPDSPPAITFEAQSVPLDDGRRIEIVGRCQGRVMDGQSRGNGIAFVVVVSGCSLTMR